MACTFNEDGSVRIDSGAPHALYLEAMREFGDPQQASDIVAVTQSEDYIGEINLKDALEYIGKKNGNQKPLTAIQNQDLKNSLMAMNVSGIDEARIKLNNAFYNSENIFSPTNTSLANSGLYSQYETQTILDDISLQERIKSSLEALNNTDYLEQDYQDYVDINQPLQKNAEFNSFGKLSPINPYIVEKTTLDTLADPATRQQFDDNLQKLDYQYTNPEALYLQMTQYKRAENWQDVDGEIISYTPLNDTLSTIEQGVIVEDNSETIGNINTLLDLSEEIISDNLEQAQTVLDYIEQDMAEKGLDLVGLSQRVDDIELKPFLLALQDFLEVPTVDATTNFTSAYNSFFGVDISPATTILKPIDLTKNYVYLRTNKSEELLLAENNLLKVADNTYIKINRLPLEQLYRVVGTYSDLIPANIGLREYVEQQMASLNSVENADLAEELVLNKMYFRQPLNVPSEIDFQEQENNEDFFEGGISDDFVADFNSAAIKEKYKDSDLWKNFYSNFKINAIGLFMVNTDPITLDNMMSWMQQIPLSNQLGQYSLVSKQMPNLIDVNNEETTTTYESERSLAVNYPQTVSKPNNESFKIDDATIITKNTGERFIRVGDDVFEVYESSDALNMFIKLPATNPNFNQYKIAPPKAEKQLKDYAYLATEQTQYTRDRNYLNRQQREEVEQQNFNCNGV